MRPARQHCSVRRDARGPGAHGLDLCSCQSSSCLPLTACSLPAQVAGASPRAPHCTAIAALPAWPPWPSRCLPTVPPPPLSHAAGWAPGTGGTAPWGAGNGSLRHILSSSCPQQTGKPDGGSSSTAHYHSKSPLGSLTRVSQGKKNEYCQQLPCPSGVRRKGLPSPSSGQGAGGVPRAQSGMSNVEYCQSPPHQAPSETGLSPQG